MEWVSFTPELYDKVKLEDSFYDMKINCQRTGRMFVKVIEGKYGEIIEKYVIEKNDDTYPFILILLKKDVDIKEIELFSEMSDYIWETMRNENLRGINFCSFDFEY